MVFLCILIDVARILLETMDAKDAKHTRAYSHLSRASEIVQQDEGTGAITEVMSTHLPPILCSVEEWMSQVNAKLPTNIRIFGRRVAPIKRFNAEMAVSHRRCEYILPVEFFYKSTAEDGPLQDFFDKFPSFDDGEVNERPSLDTIMYLFRIKKIMQSLQTQIVDLDMSDAVQVKEKEWSQRKRLKEQKTRRQGKRECENDKNEERKTLTRKPGKQLLKRRRFHNFTQGGLAHETLVYRRLDRCYHRATIRPEASKRPFMVISFTADIFLTGQVQRLVGLIIALARGIIDADFVECVFDENYPHLVPTPPAPKFAMYLSESGYNIWEGKCMKSDAIVSP